MSSALVVTRDRNSLNAMRHALSGCSFEHISTTDSCIQAIDRLKDRAFTHVFFDTSPKDIPVIEFIELTKKHQEDVIMIAISEDPQVDQVLNMIRAGARSFVVPPFTVSIVEAVIKEAESGAPFSEDILNAKDTNKAFAIMVLNHLDRLAEVMQQSGRFESAKKDLSKYSEVFTDTISLATTFSDGGPNAFLDEIVDNCLERENKPATRLGRLRNRLKKKRGSSSDGNK